MLLWLRRRQGSKGYPTGLPNYGVRHDRREHNDVRAFTEDGQELLHQEKWAAHIRCKEIVKILHRMILNGCSLADSSIGNEHIQSLPNDRANFPRQQCCSIWSSQVRLDRICASPFCVD